MLIVAAFFAFVLLAVTGGGYLVLRLRTAGATGEAAPERERLIGDPEPALAAGSALAAQLSTLGTLMPARGKEGDRLRKELFRAGYRDPSALAVFSGIRIACAALLAFAGLWAGGLVSGGASNAFLAAVCGAGFGFLLPPRGVEFLVRARAARIRTAVAPALDLLTLAIEAGQSLDSAMLDTARSLRRVYPDLCAELLFCHLEMRAGKSRYEALEHLAQRSGESELAKLAALLIDGERFGSSLGPALRTHSKYLRTHMRFAAQEKARKLTVKLVLPVFFLIFPSVLLVTLGPAYLQMRKFFETFMQ
ncbi:MAG: type II secretion system F family protein [Bryobacterales bacterium]|nr:type II secretion system F family protein [Bryobacterales bacterium]